MYHTTVNSQLFLVLEVGDYKFILKMQHPQKVNDITLRVASMERFNTLTEDAAFTELNSLKE